MKELTTTSNTTRILLHRETLIIVQPDTTMLTCANCGGLLNLFAHPREDMTDSERAHYYQRWQSTQERQHCRCALALVTDKDKLETLFAQVKDLREEKAVLQAELEAMRLVAEEQEQELAELQAEMEEGA